MKTTFGFVLLLLPLAASAANPRSIALTIQETGLAQISETHDLAPPGPDGVVRIAPLPETLMPSSVTATPLERGESLDILSQRFSNDLLDNPSLFRAFLHQPLTARKGTDTFSGHLAAIPDFSSPHPALALAGEGAVLRLLPDLLLLDSIEFPARADLARLPTLEWNFAASQPPPAAVQLHYAAAGLSWAAFHEALLAEDGRSLALSSRIHLDNRTGRDFPNARIRLALTEKGLHPPLVPAPSDPRAAKPPALRFAPDGKSWIPERAASSLATVATYDLPQPFSLPARSDLFANLVSTTLPVETRPVYDGVRFDLYQRNRRTDSNLGTEFSPTIETRLILKNETPSPLPPGEFRLLKGPANRALDWIGTAWLPALKPGESTTLHLGPATGLSGRRIRTSFTEASPLKASEESFEITVENQTTEDQTILVVEHLYRGDRYEIVAASTDHVPGDTPNTIQFQIPVKASTSQSFTYTVRYTW